MATLKIEIISGANTWAHAKTISAAHLTRLANAYRALYGQVPSGSADPVTHIVPMRDRTDAEVVQVLANGLFDGIKANVLSQERSTAGKTASDAVADLTLT